MASVTVIVPARDSADTIGRTLEAIARQEVASAPEVIVVDDGSTDETADIARRSPLRPRVVSRRTGGAGSARNLGAELATGDLLAFTDADCEPQPGWITAGLRASRSADLVQGRVLPDPGAVRGPFDRTLRVESERGLYETANLFVRRSVFARVGGFGDSRVSAGVGGSWIRHGGRPMGEDTEFGWRARRAGARTAFAADAVVHHAVLPRGPAGYVAERLRLRHFPALVRRIPEWRRDVLFAGVFLSRRTAAFDLAVAGCAVAALPHRHGVVRALVGLGCAAPYVSSLAGGATRAIPRQRPLVVATDAVADAVALASLVRGSIEARTPVL